MDSKKPQRKRKHNKAYYIKSAKQSRQSSSSTWKYLTAGMKGFLMTCNFQEKECVREAYNLLNQYADEMYGPEEGFLKDKRRGDDDAAAADAEEEEDLEAALKKEVQEMKDIKQRDRRFQVVDPGAKNCIFVKTTLDNPVELVNKIMSDAFSSKECKVRYIQRMLPITHTCRADKDKIKAMMPEILQPHLDKYPGGHPSFCVAFKVRNNSVIGRSDIYDIVGETMMDCVVDTVNPDIVVIVEVIKTICCVSVVTDYFKFRKFNMHMIVETPADGGGTVTKEAGTDSIKQLVENIDSGGDHSCSDKGQDGGEKMDRDKDSSEIHVLNEDSVEVLGEPENVESARA